ANDLREQHRAGFSIEDQSPRQYQNSSNSQGWCYPRLEQRPPVELWQGKFDPSTTSEGPIDMDSCDAPQDSPRDPCNRCQETSEGQLAWLTNSRSTSLSWPAVRGSRTVCDGPIAWMLPSRTTTV